MGAMEVASLFATLNLKDNMSPKLKTANTALGETATSAGNASSSLLSVTTALTAAGAAAGAAFLAGSVTSAVAFEKSLKNIQSITDASTADIAALGDVLNDIGSRSIAGPQAVADAYYEVAGGVQDASTRMSVLNAALAVSEAGGTSLATATTGLISVMNAYGFSADEAGYASDVFTQTTKLGTKSMAEYVAAMSPLAGLADSVGIEFDNLGAMMAFMTAQGTEAGEAATQIKSAITAVIKPNEKMKEALKKMGVESGSAAIELYGLEGTLGRIKLAFQGNDQAMAEALGSTEALQAAVAINSAGYEGFLGNFEDTMAGVTAAARAVQLQSVSAQFELLKSQFSSIAIDVGSVLLPAINSILGGINAFITDVKSKGLGTALKEWFEKGVGWLQDNGPAIFEGALKMAIDLGTSIGNWVVTNGPNIVGGIITWFEGVGAWLRDTAPGLFEGALKEAMKLGQDIAAFVLANAPNIVRGVEVWAGDAWTWIRGNFGRLLKESLTEGLNLVGDLTSTIKAAAPDIGHSIGEWIRSGLTWLTTEAPRLIQNAISGLFSGGAQDASLSDQLRGQTSGMDQVFQPIADSMNNIFGTAITGVAGLFEGLFGLKEGTLKSTFENFLGPDGPIEKLKADLQTAWNGLFGEKGALMNTANALGGLVEGAMGKVRIAVASVLKGILGPLKTLMQATVILLAAMGDNANAIKLTEGIAAIEAFQNTPAMAKGGKVRAGQPYITSENGPELFVPSTSGTILPNNILTGMGGGGGSSTVIQISGITLYGVNDPAKMFDAIESEAQRRNYAARARA